MKACCDLQYRKENGEFCVTVGHVTSTAGILV